MIAIVDYGMGNLGSIRNMLSRLGVEAIITSDCRVIRLADKLILPGVGAFDQAMQSLRTRNLIDVLAERVLADRVPILGICLGMQLFSKRSDEGELPGLGWIDAETVRFDFSGLAAPLRLPHMGWNTLDIKQANPIVVNETEDDRYYFVHSYHLRCAQAENILATTCYGIAFASAVIQGNLIGTQFHPEKSHKYGMRLMRRFAEI